MCTVLMQIVSLLHTLRVRISRSAAIKRCAETALLEIVAKAAASS